MINEEKNVKKAILFEKPDYIPMDFHINPACWDTYPQEALCELIEQHPFLFPNFQRPKLPYTPDYSSVARKDHPYTDDWGCVWQTTQDGITGTVVKHPLADWDAYSTYTAPNPEHCMGIGPINWNEEKEKIDALHKNHRLAVRGLRHGHTFLQICDIRGYQNVILDMADEEPKFQQLLDEIVEFNTYIIKQYLSLGADIVTYAEDLGMQFGPMLSPDNFKTYFLSAYQKMMAPAKEKGTLIHMHSDGDIRTLIPYLMQGGVQIFNLQDLVNGIPWIKSNLKNKVCIDLDIDRQNITPYGTPEQIDQLIREEVQELGSPHGGLMMIYGLYPGLPLENVKAVMDAMEKYAFYYN
ncbi:MAG: uroporphyrinogen decarboxylase family protein [Massiliimalia sp.]|jgi:uroporphyrinogen decarboxylase